MEGYINMWKNFGNFRDRTSVRGYWGAILVNIVILGILMVIGYTAGSLEVLIVTSIMQMLYIVVAIVPTLALTVRRLRDSGRKWYWIFVACIPAVGWIIYFFLMCAGSVEDDGIPVI